MNRLSRAVSAALALCMYFSLASANETLYITDKLTVHVIADLNNPDALIKAVAAGSQVEVLERQQDYVLIRTANNFQGWIHSKYLSEEQPAHLAFMQAQKNYTQLETQYRALQQRAEQLEELAKDAATAAWLRNELNQTNDRIRQLEANIVMKNARITALERDNQNLEKALHATQAQLDPSPNASAAIAKTPSNPNTLNKPPSHWQKYFTAQNNVSMQWFVVSLIITAVFGMLLGSLLIDYRLRKRAEDIHA